MIDFQRFRSQGLVLAIIIVMILMATASFRFWSDLPNQLGVDFYQFWGIAKSQQSSGFRLGSPYRNPAGYQQQLLKLAAVEGDAELVAAVGKREQPDLTGSPLLYYLLGMLPQKYTVALWSFRTAQFVAFALAAFLLVRRLTSGPVSALTFAVALAAAFDPLLLDMAVGNLSSFQLLGLVLVAGLLEQGGASNVRIGLAQALLVTVVLVLLTLVKPSIAAATALAGLCLYRKTERRVRTIIAVTAGAVCALLYALPCMLFNSASVWADWWSGTFSSVDRLAYAGGDGNYSGVGLLSSRLGISIAAAMALVGTFLLVSLLWPIVSVCATTSKAGRDYLAVIRNGLVDPYLCIAFGVVVSFALSPLVWSHYQVLGIIPALWLCWNQGTRNRLPRIAGWLALLLMADLPRRIYLLAGVPWILIEACHGFSWLLLWVGMITVCHLQERERIKCVAVRSE
ncbi:glycosyltransferase 87 family protein [Nevskia soli]|uniref:glycosyltransferase 87 family protein n=1 Tax=Nevskia soli TaxID=418856 RepID=UPI0004A775C6|nr:glycosyltransferase 87 family protein [Nevskia soli]